jgi:hypothetical protein
MCDSSKPKLFYFYERNLVLVVSGQCEDRFMIITAGKRRSSLNYIAGENGYLMVAQASRLCSDGVLLSHVVSSALPGLTTQFRMGS